MNTNQPRRITWLFIRNKTIALLALCIGAGMILFGLNGWLDLLWVLPGWLLCLFLWQTVQAIHPRRPAIIKRTTPAEFGLEYEEVHFPSRDGLKLSGYYLKGTRREAIILAHGSGGGGVTLSAHGRFLQKAGFPVLLLNLRAHANSEGNTIDGVQETNDILGAVDHLGTRQEIAADKIGALGVSLGAHTALHAAVQTKAIRALVLEGIGPVDLEDHGGKPTTLRRKINYPINWLVYKIGDFFAGIHAPSNTSALKRLQCPVMIISTGRGKEQYFSRLLFAAASEPKELWEIPTARHAAGYFQDTKLYADRVASFFNAHLT